MIDVYYLDGNRWQRVCPNCGNDPSETGAHILAGFHDKRRRGGKLWWYGRCICCVCDAIWDEALADDEAKITNIDRSRRGN